MRAGISSEKSSSRRSGMELAALRGVRGRKGRGEPCPERRRPRRCVPPKPSRPSQATQQQRSPRSEEQHRWERTMKLGKTLAVVTTGLLVYGTSYLSRNRDNPSWALASSGAAAANLTDVATARPATALAAILAEAPRAKAPEAPQAKAP